MPKRHRKADRALAIYRYSENSLLDEVTILTNESGGTRAYLHARDGATSEDLRSTKQCLRARGYQCVPSILNGTPVLEVRGFNKKEELLQALGALKLTDGEPTQTTSDAGDKRGFFEKAKSHTLQMAGFSYNIGDAAYMFYTAGLAHDEWPKATKQQKFFSLVGVLGGIGYGLGSLCLTFFGARDQSINTIRASTSKIERFARKEGYNVPDESSIAFVNDEPKRSLLGNVGAFISRYPSEVLNTIYMGVGICIAASSFYKGTRRIPDNLDTAERLKALKSNRNDLIDVGLGVVTATSAMIGIGVKESKRLENEPKRHGIGGVIDWIREKPLRATGIGYGIATAWHGVATYNHWVDKTEPKKYLKGRVVFIAANIFSEVMLAISSKGHGVGVKPDVSVDETVMATAAELVLRQPEEKREPIIRQLAGYMASPDVLAVKADVVEASLRAHIDALDNNPWTRHFNGYESPAPAEEAAPALQAGKSSANDEHAPPKLAGAVNDNAGLPQTKVSGAVAVQKMVESPVALNV